jgi:hypothetical protein
VKNKVVLTMLLLHGATTYAGQGWYLMLPPTAGEAGNVLRADAPLREWRQMRAYDTANACEADRMQIFEGIEKSFGKGSAPSKHIASSLCIASDDPRLSK